MIPTSSPDLSCPVCREPHLVTGESEALRRRALTEWSGCCVKPLPEAPARVPRPLRERLALAAMFLGCGATWALIVGLAVMGRT